MSLAEARKDRQPGRKQIGSFGVCGEAVSAFDHGQCNTVPIAGAASLSSVWQAQPSVNPQAV
jgi:hypothetical protein